MSSARDVITETLLEASGTGESCEMKARWISEALTRAGFRILAPDELDPATVERCAQVVEHDDRSERAKGVGFIPDWLHHARRKAAELRTLNGGKS